MRRISALAPGRIAGLLLNRAQFNRPQHKAPMILRGGGDSKFPIDAPTALKINAGVFAAYGALVFPDLNIPLVDVSSRSCPQNHAETATSDCCAHWQMAMKKHDTRASLFYNDLSPENPSQVKNNRWIGSCFLSIAVTVALHSESDIKCS